MRGLRCLFSIAFVEWKLQIRSAIFWASLITLLVYSLGQVIGASSKFVFLPRHWLGTRDDSLVWLGIGLIFIIPSVVDRDRQTAALIWTTPVTGGCYAAGKLAGIYLTSLTLATGELVSQILVRTPHWKELSVDNIGLLFSSLPLWLIGVFYISSVYYLLTVLVKGQIPYAYILNGIYFIVLISIKDVANPFSAFPYPIFRSDLVVNGPETGLFHAHSSYYATLTIVISVLSIFVYAKREQKVFFPKKAQWTLFLVFIIGFGVTTWNVYRFLLAKQAISERIVLKAEDSSSQRRSIDKIRVTSLLLPEQGKLSGEIRLTLSRPEAELPIYIPPGINLVTVNDCEGSSLSFHDEDPQFVQIEAASEICMTFEGTLYNHRASYQRTGYVSPEDLQSYVAGYIGQGYLYLFPSSNWYPYFYDSDLSEVDYLIEVTIPQGLMISASPAPEIEQDGDWITYRWYRPKGEPWITLAAGHYEQVTMSTGDVLFVSPEHQHVGEQTATFYLEFITAIDQLINSRRSPFTIIETPVLRWPIISSGTVHLPERYFIDQLTPAIVTEYESRIKVSGIERAYLQELYSVALGFMRGHMILENVRSSEEVEFSHPLARNTLVSSNDQLQHTPLPECLALYLSLRLADDKFGTHHLDVQISESTRYSEQDSTYPLFEKNELNSPFIPTYSREGSRALHRFFTALGRMEQQIGREKVIFLIGQLAKIGKGSIVSIDDWLEVIEKNTSLEISQDFKYTISTGF